MGEFDKGKLFVSEYTINYCRPSFIREPNESRQKNLKSHFHFDCSCEACMNSYPISFNNALKSDILLIKNGRITSNSEWIEKFKSNCQTILMQHKKFPSEQLCKLMDRNLYLLAAIARNEPFLF